MLVQGGMGFFQTLPDSQVNPSKNLRLKLPQVKRGAKDSWMKQASKC